MSIYFKIAEQTVEQLVRNSVTAEEARREEDERKGILPQKRAKPTLKTLADHNQEVLKRHNDLLRKTHSNGIECPQCREELVDSQPNVTLSSFPAQKHIHCQRCGYKGTRFV